MTGVVKSVSTCETMRPPTMAMPSGRRSSLPTPMPIASGSAPKKRGECRHHNGPKAHQAGLIDRFFGTESFVALGVEREIHHHDRVLFHDADEQDDADRRDDRKLVAAHKHREQRSQSRRRQRGKNRERVDQTFVKHAEHDVDGDERGQNEKRLRGKGRLKNLRCPGKAAANAGRHAEFARRALNDLRRLA